MSEEHGPDRMTMVCVTAAAINSAGRYRAGTYALQPCPSFQAFCPPQELRFLAALVGEDSRFRTTTRSRC